MTVSDPPFLRTSGLTKQYPGVLALNGADLTIESGEVLGLVGKNGAGKSTLIKMLAGAVTPDAGQILIDGNPVVVRGPASARQLGLAFVHQETSDVPNLTVAENIQLGLGYPHVAGAFISPRDLRDAAAQTLARLGADIDPAAKVSSLSTAQRRMVMIARGLAAQARLLVLDEPTASLTDQEIRHLHDLLRRLAADGMSIVYVSHRLAEIFAITDRVAVMRDGRVVHTGPTGDVSRQQLIRYITGHSRDVEQRRPRQAVPRGAELLRVQSLSATGTVHEASLSVHRGEIVGIAGLVGSGRTELARAIFGADRSTGGTVHVSGRPVRRRGPKDAMRAGIVLLPEDRRHHGAVTTWSVRKNITLPALRQHRYGGRRSPVPLTDVRDERRTAERFMQRLAIKTPHAEYPVKNLSGGNQQKVILAKWLHAGAEVFFFDEPTHGIDVDGKAEVYRLMEELVEAGKGVVFISSEFSELVGVCDRVLVMREGRITGEVTGDLITEQELVSRCYAP